MKDENLDCSRLKKFTKVKQINNVFVDSLSVLFLELEEQRLRFRVLEGIDMERESENVSQLLDSMQWRTKCCHIHSNPRIILSVEVRLPLSRSSYWCRDVHSNRRPTCSGHGSNLAWFNVAYVLLCSCSGWFHVLWKIHRSAYWGTHKLCKKGGQLHK